MRIQLIDICHGRSGDKGNTANVGIIARRPEVYPFIEQVLTMKVVKDYFGDMVDGPVERYELPNLGALNFLLHGALGGGGTKSLKNDAQGKTLAAALLRMEIEVPKMWERAVAGGQARRTRVKSGRRKRTAKDRTGVAKRGRRKR